MSRYAILLICVGSTIGIVTDAARILALFPYPSHSHQVVFNMLSKELWRRGHDMVIFTTEPTKDRNLSNYVQIDLSDLNSVINAQVNYFERGQYGLFSFLRHMYHLLHVFADRTFSDPYMQRLIHSNATEKFDLIIVESLYMDALYGLSYYFNAPSISIITLPMLTMNYYLMGNPISAADTPDLIFAVENKQFTLWQRLNHIYYILRQIYDYVHYVHPMQDKLMRKYLGNDMPYVADIVRNTSLFLTYVNPYFMYPQANVPSIVYFGDCHLQGNETIPSDLKRILDKSPEGVIYFSMGSNIKSIHMPEKNRALIMSIFAELPYKIIWKFEDDKLVNKSDNIIIRKWLPQQALLAHPNIILFMYQGGLQSTVEAIHNAVPVIGFPLFSDQAFNIRRMESLGVGKFMDILNLDREILKRSIIEITSDLKYKERAVKLRKIFQDLPYNPLENAIWWIEHVIRHKGAPHIYNKSRDIPVYQKLMLDIIGILLISLLLLLYVTVLIIKRILKLKAYFGRQPQKDMKTD